MAGAPEDVAQPVRAAYERRVEVHAAARAHAERVSRSYSRWRLATFLPALGLLIWGLGGGGVSVSSAGAALMLAFGVLVVRHARVEERSARCEALRQVNLRAIARLERNWDALPPADPPHGITIEAHPYAWDLDLFGRASVYQWLGPAATPHGAAALAGWLLTPAPPAEIRERQDAVDELAAHPEWREELSAYRAEVERERGVRIERFLAWCESGDPPLPLFNLLRPAVYLTLASLWILIALHAAGAAPALWSIPLLAGLVLSFVTAPAVQRVFDAAGSGEVALRRFAPLLAHVVEPAFRSPWLAAAQHRFRSNSEVAPQAMARLNRILGFSELRRGAAILHFPIQSLTLWDFHVLFALMRWRRVAGSHVRDWLAAAGEIDALACLAGIRHDYPDWCRTRMTTDKVMRAAALGHPLLPDHRRVANDVAVGPPGTVLLVTGSNMSGKSTLLRAIGLNAVLAQAGAPACASDLEMPAIDLQTSIRIQDSLERGVSYFMAALGRLKAVLDAADRESPDRVVLYLLDEILQGTNSAERAIAVQAVARHLLQAGAIGAMTTHDLTVAERDPLRSAAVLVHFTETVDDSGGMDFDYKLRPGLATSRNALRLMQLIGIR
jgi:hypothetical protein